MHIVCIVWNLDYGNSIFDRRCIEFFLGGMVGMGMHNLAERYERDSKDKHSKQKLLHKTVPFNIFTTNIIFH